MQAALSPFPAPPPIRSAQSRAARLRPGLPEVPRQTSDPRAQPGPPPRPPSSLPAAPAAPRRPERRAPHFPARAAKPPPGRFPSSPAVEGRRVRGSPARRFPGRLGGALGADRAARRSNFVALGTAQSSLPRRAGGAAQALTQQLARRRAGPCSRPPVRPSARALRASGAVSLAARPRLRGAAGGRPPRLDPSGKGWHRPGRVCAEEVQTSLFSGLEGGVGVQGPQRAEVPGETHPTHKQSSGGGRRESFSVWCCLARRSGQKAECSVFCHIIA